MQPMSPRVGSISERSASTSRPDSPGDVEIMSVRRVTPSRRAGSVPCPDEGRAMSAKLSLLNGLRGCQENVLRCAESAAWRENRGKPEMSESAIAARDPELDHTALERARLHLEEFGGAAGATNPPPGALEDGGDVLALHVGQRHALT
jgi:hypothetical protein